MLDRPALVLEPWRVAADGPLRVICDRATGVSIGHAVRAAKSSWWRPAGIVVHEAPDGSLLLTVHWRWWFDARHVWDADGQLLALVRGRTIRAADGRPLAHWARNEGVFRLANGIEAATVSEAHGAIALNFHPRVADEPFLKMALLAAVL